MEGVEIYLHTAILAVSVLLLRAYDAARSLGDHLTQTAVASCDDLLNDELHGRTQARAAAAEGSLLPLSAHVSNTVGAEQVRFSSGDLQTSQEGSNHAL